MNGLELLYSKMHGTPRTKNDKYPVAALSIDPVVNFVCRIVQMVGNNNGLASSNGGASPDKELIGALEV